MYTLSLHDALPIFAALQDQGLEVTRRVVIGAETALDQRRRAGGLCADYHATVPGQVRVGVVAPVMHQVAALQDQGLEVAGRVVIGAETALDQRRRAGGVCADYHATVPGPVRVGVVAPVMHQVAALQDQGLVVTLRVVIRAAPAPTLFPYATLFRSDYHATVPGQVRVGVVAPVMHQVAALQDQGLEVTRRVVIGAETALDQRRGA